MLGHLGEAREIFGITPFTFGRKGSLTFRDPGVRGWWGAVQIMQSDDQVPYPLTQIQGALAVQKRGECGGGEENERRGGWERERTWSELFRHWAASL